jgi:hypothetical protein
LIAWPLLLSYDDVSLEVGKPPDQHSRRDAVQDLVVDVKIETAIGEGTKVCFGRREVLQPPRNGARRRQLNR